MKLIISIFFIMCSLSIYTLYSQDDELKEMFYKNEILSAKLSVKLALEQNTELLKFKEQINHKKAEKYINYGINSPIISYMQEGIPDYNSSIFSEKRFTITQSIEFPYYSYLKIERTDKEIQAMQIEYEWRKKKIISETKLAYAKIIYWLEILRLRNEIKNISDNLYEIVKTKFDFGQSNNIDLLNAELLKLEAENDYNEGIKNLMLARYDLFYLIGLDTEKQKYSISFSDSLKYFDFNISQQEILSKLEKTYEYQSLKKYEESFNYKLSESWASLLPKIDINLYKQNIKDGYNYSGFEIGINLPLWFGLDKQTQIRQAQSMYDEFQITLRDSRLKIKKEIEHSWHSYEISKKTIENYKFNISDKSQKLLQLTLEAYQLGNIDLLNFLNVQKSYINSKIRYLDALYDYYQQVIHLEKYLDNDVVFID